MAIKISGETVVNDDKSAAFQSMNAGVKTSANYPTNNTCLLYTSPSPRDATLSRMPSSA